MTNRSPCCLIDQPSLPAAKMTRQGFSLLEVMIGMMILAMAIMATFTAMMTAENTHQNSSEINTLVQALEQTIEYIHTKPHATIKETFDGQDSSYLQQLGVIDVDGLHAVDAATPIIQVSVTESTSGALEITLNCNWESRHGQSTYALTYYLVQRGG